MPTLRIEGATSGQGAVTGREYSVPAGEAITIDVPEGEAETLPPNRVTVLDGPERSFSSSGSWKTLYEDGEEIGTVQCMADEAEAWKRGDLDLSDLQD